MTIEQQAEELYPIKDLYSNAFKMALHSQRAAYIKGANSRTLPVPWVKASTRLPQHTDLVHIKYNNGKTNFISVAYCDDNATWYRQFNDGPLSWQESIEWLDESATLPTPEEVFDFAEGLKTSYAAEELLRKVIAFAQTYKQ